MAADITSEAAFRTAAGGVSMALAWSFGITPELLGAGLVGSMLGLSFVKDEVTALRAAAQFVGYALGAAMVARWAVDKDAARVALAFVIALAGNPLVRVVLASAGKYGGEWAERVFGPTAKTKGKKS